MSSQRFEPVPDRDAATRLGAALRRIDYSEDAIDDLLGEDALSTDAADVPVHERRLRGDSSPLAIAARFFLLQLPVDLSTAAEALAQDGIDALLTLGLAAVDGQQLVPLGRLVPAEELLMAFDGFARGVDDPPQYVAPYTPTASWLASLTPRRHVARALDVGTGNGIHALLAAQHSDHVIATDVNQRALAFTAINAALNELDNIETRPGSLFEPVSGETFDLITCNAPTSSPGIEVGVPRRRVARRRALGARRPTSRQVAQGGRLRLAPRQLGRLRRGRSGRAPRRLARRQRLRRVGARAGGRRPLEHAAGWNEHLAPDPEAYGAALDE